MAMASRVPALVDRYHPSVALLFVIVSLGFSMAAMQPVYLLLTFAGQTALSVSLKGGAKALRGVLWQAPLVLVLAIANPLFVSVGSTELFRIGLHAVYLEAVVFGLAQGLLLANALLAFTNAAQLLSSDKVLSLVGNALPVISLMISMVMRLIPSFVRRGRAIGDVQRACTAAHPVKPGKADGIPLKSARAFGRATRSIPDAFRLSTVLMGWGMEDSLETADAMRARGWNCGARRTSYQRYRFRRQDGWACACIAALALAAAFSAATACSQFSFYPRLGGLAPWYSYAPYALFLALPFIAAAIARSPR